MIFFILVCYILTRHCCLVNNNGDDEMNLNPALLPCNCIRNELWDTLIFSKHSYNFPSAFSSLMPSFRNHFQQLTDH